MTEQLPDGVTPPTEAPPAIRLMKLRYASHCASCGRDVQRGEQAEWNRETRTVTCLDCRSAPALGTGDAPSPGVGVHEQAVTGGAERPTVLAFDSGVAGASALHEYERRHAKREKRIEEKWGRLAPLVRILSDDPSSTTVWQKGSVGEQRLARHLTRELGDRAYLLHDRKVPRTRGNIDHLAVASSGVWVIDAKNYSGKVEKRDVGGLFRVDLQLYVGGRRQTRLVEGLAWQVSAVRTALEDDTVPIHAALCFTDAEWGFFAKPFQLQDVWVTWAAALVEKIAAPGPIARAGVETTAQRLAEKLKANAPGASAN